MKRVIVLLIFGLSAVGSSFANAPQTTQRRSNSTMNAMKRIGVAYLGGSITEGGAASDFNKTSWRALTTAWFRKQFPDKTIDEINAGIGGTASNLGAFRLDRDVLQHKPDVLFVEFAVNDEGHPREAVLRAMEGIVRHSLRYNPRLEIIFIYTATMGWAPAEAQGKLFDTVTWHEEITRHYRIPSVNVGQNLLRTIREGKGTREHLIPDTVHPSDSGHALYARQITDFLEKHFQSPDVFRPKSLPKPMTKNPLENGKLIDAWTIESKGWTRENESLAGRYPHRLAANTPGTTLTYAFEGIAVGLYWLIAPDSGDIEWSIDGGAPQRVPSWDKYALAFSRAGNVVLNDNLSPGRHVLTIKILPDHQPESKGTWLRIAAVMVN